MSTQAQVCVPVINLHSQPDETSEVISQALYGWRISILEKRDDFYYIQTRDGYQGWVEGKGVLFCFRQESLKRLKLVYNRVPIYPAAHVKSKPLWIFPFEVELAVLAEPIEEEGRWIQVELLEGITGWVQRGHVTFDLNPLSLDQILQLSRQFLGLPYIWGGTSSFGYDCSGFIQMLGRQRGILLPRDASQQFKDAKCTPIAWENLEAGNLLFYGSCETDIRHVGIYIGHHNLIHSSVKPIPILQETHLNESVLRQRFAFRTARRLQKPGSN